MSRIPDHNAAWTGIITAGVLMLVATTSLGCDELDARGRNRVANRAFRDSNFITAVGEYEKALTQIEDPTIRYNLGLAYSKVFKVGFDGPVRLDRKGSLACNAIPKVKYEADSVCVKEDDTKFTPCNAKDVCASSYTCEKLELCTVDNVELAELAAVNFQTWLKSHEKDDDTRKLMTQIWLDSKQYGKAMAYWEARLATKPNDPAIMGILAGVNLKAGDWRKSIEWYTKVADANQDDTNKVAAFTFIGNVAWSKLASKTLTPVEVIELADKGAGALARVIQSNPKNPKPYGLMGSIYNFRAMAHGSSLAWNIDRATARDLQLNSCVLSNEANPKKANCACKVLGLDCPPPPPAPPAPGAPPGVPPTTPTPPVPAEAPPTPKKPG